MGSSLFAGRYRLGEALSTTAMADVRTATDVVLDRRVVVKLLGPQADRSRFEREAQAAAALAHPNIVQLFDYGEADGRPYIVFEYLPAAPSKHDSHVGVRCPTARPPELPATSQPALRTLTGVAWFIVT
jgi:serine/threonine protein kinase